jgi:uncharacterized membrane protein
MSSRATRILLCSALMAVAIGAGIATSASAAPTWKFEGKALEGNETVAGTAAALSMNVSSFTTTCESTLQMTIWNSAGQAKGQVTKLTFANCSTNVPECTVEATGEEQLPWSARGLTVAPSNYLILEGIRVGILYDDEECPLDEILVVVKGSAGGLFDNGTSTAFFDVASFSATGTKMTMLGSTAKWKGAFPIEATGAHSGETLTLS